jgi:hypothetical protein
VSWATLEHLDFSDGVGWIALGLSVILGLSGWVANRRLSKRIEGANSQFDRMASALEHRNQIAEEALEADRVAASPNHEDIPRIWLTENLRKNKYILRNMGPGPATGVRIDPSRIECIKRDLPDGVTLEQGQSHAFLLFGTWQSGGAPDEIWVRSDDEPEWRPVRLEHIYD